MKLTMTAFTPVLLLIVLITLTGAQVWFYNYFPNFPKSIRRFCSFLIIYNDLYISRIMISGGNGKFGKTFHQKAF